MYSYKKVGQYRIYNRLTSRHWEGKELIKRYTYYCHKLNSKESDLATNDYDEAVQFCIDNSPPIKEKGEIVKPLSKLVRIELLNDIKSLFDANIPELLKMKKFQFTDRIQNENDLNEMLKKLQEIIDRP
jgi:hypothetical protein